MLEAEVPLQQRERHGLERRDDKGGAHGHDDEGQLWSTEEVPQRDRRDDGREQAHAPHEHGQAIELTQLLATQLTDGEDRSAQPKFGEQRHQAEIYCRHAHETVVLGGEQPGDDQPGEPVEPLAPPPGCRGPRDAAQQGAIEGSGLAGRRGPCQVGKRR